MKLSLIAAMAKNKVIGNEKNEIPWFSCEDLKEFKKEDLKRFKVLTSGKCVVMGRKTYESIGRPLPNRLNVVISKTLGKIDGLVVVQNLSDAIDIARANIEKYGDEVFVIGGGEIYKQTLGLADKLYLTILDKEFPGNTLFPEVPFQNWNLESEEQKNGFKFETYVKTNS